MPVSAAEGSDTKPIAGHGITLIPAAPGEEVHPTPKGGVSEATCEGQLSVPDAPPRDPKSHVPVAMVGAVQLHTAVISGVTYQESFAVVPRGRAPRH